MKVWRWSLMAAILAMVAACQLPKLDARTDAEVRRVFDDLRHGDQAALNARLAPALRTPDAQAQIAAVRGYIPKGEPRSRKVVAWNVSSFSGQGKVVAERDEYDYGDRVTLVDTRLRQPQGASAFVVEGFHVQTATTKELAVNSFSLAGKTLAEYAFLAATVLSPALMVWALVKVIRRRGLRRKWLWGVLAFAGLFTFRMNWATGQVAANFLSVQLIGAGIASGLSRFDAWVLTVTAPIGALLILSGVWANPKRAREPGPQPPNPEAF
jgi:hypothetical protein